jgi:toxin ParE1/3/4
MVRYTVPALADLNSILDYIAAHSPQGAIRVQARIKQIVDLLLTHPRMGVRTDDPTIRRVTTSPYPNFVFYEPTETEIIIHAVRHAARDPSGMPGSM